MRQEDYQPWHYYCHIHRHIHLPLDAVVKTQTNAFGWWHVETLFTGLKDIKSSLNRFSCYLYIKHSTFLPWFCPGTQTPVHAHLLTPSYATDSYSQGMYDTIIRNKTDNTNKIWPPPPPPHTHTHTTGGRMNRIQNSIAQLTLVNNWWNHCCYDWFLQAWHLCVLLLFSWYFTVYVGCD